LNYGELGIYGELKTGGNHTMEINTSTITGLLFTELLKHEILCKETTDPIIAADYAEKKNALLVVIGIFASKEQKAEKERL
jgi:rRNA pseudouridine-1189 N-methylase Emg1 (Nep1/Mra1 family)